MPQTKYKVLIAQFPYGNTTHPDVSEWITEVVIAMREDPRIGPEGIFHSRIADTPITFSRNRCLAEAEKMGIDFVLMVDSDMRPDVEFDAYGQPTTPTAKRFWGSSFDFALASDEPCIIGAPYCGPPPHENVYVFRWTDFTNDNPNPDFTIQQYTRFEAAGMTGFHDVAALPTGVMLIDVRALKHLPHPRFYYEPKDPTYSEKATTEDVAFSRDLLAVGAELRKQGKPGIRVICAFDSWAGHYKLKLVTKPQFVDPGKINAKGYEGMDFYSRIRDARAPAVTEANACASDTVMPDRAVLPDQIASRNVIVRPCGDARIPALADDGG